VKIILRAGGIIRNGPEREIIDDYLKRAQGLARGTGFTGVEEQQVDLRSAKSRSTETRSLLSNLPASAKLVIFDERGKTPTSRQISKQIANWRTSRSAPHIGPSDRRLGRIKWCE